MAFGTGAHRGLALSILCLLITSITSSPSIPKSSISSRVISTPRGSTIWQRARSRARLEQEVEDFNAPFRYSGQLRRRLIVLPLTEDFEVPITHFSHGKLQFGDKASLPASLGHQILGMKLEVPWQFEVKREISDSASTTSKPVLNRIFCSVLDFRAPENFVFLPDWMMQSLALKPFDTVEFSCVKLKMASSVKLQPHSSNFLSIQNRQSVLENELRHYSSLTKGTTISFMHDAQVYVLDVVDTKSGRSDVEAVCIQDSDVATDILPPKAKEP